MNLVANRTSPQRRALVRVLVAGSLLATLSSGAPSLADEASITIEGVVSNDTDPTSSPVFIDTERQLLYATGGDARFDYRDVLSEFDLTKPFGQMRTRSAYLPLKYRNWSSVSFEPSSRTLFVFDVPGSVGQAACATALDPTCPSIRGVSLDTMTFTDERWDVGALVPGIWPVGMTYSEADRRFYLLAIAASVTATTTSFLITPVSGVLVLAIDRDKSGPQSVAWIKPIRSCVLPQLDSGSGAPIYRSARMPFLYFGCMRTDGLYATSQHPGRSGAVRLRIDPKATGAAAVSSEEFKEDFFRAPGAFSTSVVSNTIRTAFDPATERLVMVSRATPAPGAWVFDGLRSIWAGFIPTGSNNNGIGMDPSTGLVVVKDSLIGVRIADVRESPVGLGETRSIPDPVHFTSDQVVFDGRGRMYWTVGSGEWTGTVVAARVPQLPPSIPLEPKWDELTHDIPEQPGITTTTYAGSAEGFGARLTAIGGPGGITSRAWIPLVFRVEKRVGTLPIVGSSDRGIHVGYLRKLDLRGSGAEAATQAFAPDTSTADDESNVRNTDLYFESVRASDAAFDEAGVGGGTESPAAKQAREALATLRNTVPQNDEVNVWVPASSVPTWPWPGVDCSDGGGERQDDDPSLAPENETAAGSESAKCDLEGELAEGAARGHGVQTDVVSIADAGIVSKTERHPGRVVVKTTAWSRGIEIAVPGGSTLRIDEVSQSVVTEAGGRTGTANIAHRPSISGVEVVGADGKSETLCQDTCDPEFVADLVNDAVGADLRMTVPEVEIVKTPKGAHARFRESFDQYVNDFIMNNDPSQAAAAVQFEVFTDARDKSRTFVQLAAIDSSSLYGITKPEDDSPPCFDCDNPCPPDCESTAPPEVRYPEELQPTDRLPGSGGFQPPPVSQSLPVRMVEQALFLVRSPAEAASMALVLSLIVGFIVLSARRRSLGGVL